MTGFKLRTGIDRSVAQVTATAHRFCYWDILNDSAFEVPNQLINRFGPYKTFAKRRFR